MKDIVDFLVQSQVQYFATTGTDGRPKVRPFQFMFEKEGRIYYCTSNQKTVHRELKAQPWVEICASGKDFSWLRLSGRVSFVSDLALKALALEASPLVKSIYKTADNPAFEVFFLADAGATISDFSGKPPRTYAL